MGVADEIRQLNQWRQYVVYAAIGLLLVSLAAPSMGLAVLRSLAWVGAGVLSLLVATKARAAGAQASYGNAVLYFLVALVPLMKGR